MVLFYTQGAEVLDWSLYIESILDKYDCWWSNYTFTDVVGKKHNKQAQKSLLFDLQAIAVTADREQSKEANSETEVLNVLEGLRKYLRSHVLLVGRPGSGKSTALVRLLLEEAQKFRDREGIGKNGDKEDNTVVVSSNARAKNDEEILIPVLVELRYYETSILDLITSFLHRHDPSLATDSERIKALLRSGRFLLLLDGVNEIPSQQALLNLQKFRQDYQQTTPMVFTTRDLGVGGDLGISKKLEMQPLTEAQMEEFVRCYLRETGEQMLQQLGGRLREFGETPLLLQMLCSVFASNSNQIPPNLGLVFRRFTETYDRQLKQGIPVSDESRRWCPRLLQHLAWVMMGGRRDTPFKVSTTPTELLVAIPQQPVEEIFTKFLEGKVPYAADCAISCLEDLLKHHLIQIGADNKIEFRHQLIQEYYAAEKFVEIARNLSDDELKWDYLNYLKWTEPAALMVGLLDDKHLALRVVNLALEVDWHLGARLAGSVIEWQEETVNLVKSLSIPLLLKIQLLGETKSDRAIPVLIKLLEHSDSNVRFSTASALEEIKSEQAIPGLIKLLEDSNSSVRFSAANALGEIKSEQAIRFFRT